MIVEEVKKGDFGHTDGQAKDGCSLIDHTLVPTNIHVGGRYLRDVKVRVMLNRMVEKGLHVTLVLDTCHVDGVTIDLSAEVPTATRSLSSNFEGGIYWNRSSTDWLDLPLDKLDSMTESTERTPWQPDGWVIISLGPGHQGVGEILNHESNKWHGILTYNLINILRNAPENTTHAALHERLQKVIAAKTENQVVTIVGNIPTSLFLNVGVEVTNKIDVGKVDRERGTVELQAGQTNGVLEGDIYGIFPRDYDGNISWHPDAKVRVTDVCLEDSSAVLEEAQTQLDSVEGHLAVLLKRAIPRTHST